MLNSVMDSLGECVVVLDPAGVITGVNSVWRDFAAKNGAPEPVANGIGLDYFAACRRAAAEEDYAAATLSGLEAVRAGKIPSFSLEYPCHSPEKERWYVTHVRPLGHPGNGLVVTHVDITKRKIAEAIVERDRQREELLRTILETVLKADSLVIALEQVLDVLLSAHCLGLLPKAGILRQRGHGEKPLVLAVRGMTEQALLHFFPRRSVPPSRPSQAGGIFLVPIIAGTRRIGSLLLFRPEPTQNDVDTDHFMASVADILANYIPRVEAEQALVAQQAELEETVKARTAALRDSETRALAALNVAQVAVEAKSRFLANMSHEIRTPLNAILGFAQIGQRDAGGSKLGLAFSRIVTAGEHLLGVINDILDLSKIEAGKMQIEKRPFGLRETIDQVVSLLASRAAAKTIGFSVILAPDLPDWTEGDGLRVAQILTNLLGNAIKFTQAGEVRLSVRREQEQVFFTVTDTGIGLSPAQIGQLFQSFEQADNSITRAYGGTGLGLVISRDLARLMGGDVTVASMLNVGSSFTLRLPLYPVAPPHATARPSGPEGRRLAGMVLLAADDVEFNRLILEDILRHEGAEVLFAEDGEQALARLQHGSRRFDAVLMDVQMPVMDGLTCSREIRRLCPSLPVIGLTAHALAEERQNCLAAGMVDVVTKPIDIDILVATLRQHIANNPTPADGGDQPHLVGEDDTRTLVASASIDWPALVKSHQGRWEFIRKLGASLVRHYHDTPDQLRNAAARGDREDLLMLCHKLKGTAGSLHAARLAKLSSEGEAQARAAHSIDAARYSEIAAALEELLAEIALVDRRKIGV